MNINWRDDVIALVWISEKGIEFDLNPTTFPKLLKSGQSRALGAAVRDFGEAILHGKVEITAKGPTLYGPTGKPIN